MPTLDDVFKHTDLGAEMFIADLNDLGSGIRVPMGPEISGGGGANYNEVAPIGGAAAHLDFSHTANDQVRLGLHYNRDSLAYSTPSGKPKTQADATQIIMDHWKFLAAMKVPYRQPDGWTGGEAPLLQLTIPHVLEWVCRLTNLTWAIRKRDVRGLIVDIMFTCTFKEDPDRRWTSQDILEHGMQRF